MTDIISRGGKIYHLTFWLISASKELRRTCCRQPEQRGNKGNKRTPSACWHLKKYMWLYFHDQKILHTFLYHCSGYSCMDVCIDLDLKDDCNCLSTIKCLLSLTQKCILLKCPTVLQKNDVYHKCNDYASLHRIKSAWCPVSYVLHGCYLIVSAESSLGVSWLEILTGGSLQSSDNLHVPFQRSLFEIL